MKWFSILLLVLSVALVPGWAQQGKSSSSSSSASSSSRSDPGGSASDRGYIDPDESLFSRQPLPDGPISLIGGTVQDIDRVQNRIKVKVIAGGTRTMSFDDRTRVLRDGEAITYDKIRKGDRVYVDTLLYQNQVFARSIRIENNPGQADARGQITAYDPASGSISLVDELSSEAVDFKVDSKTEVKRKNGPARVSDLVPGSLVTVKFVPGQNQEGLAREISILAEPGGSFVFAGTITNIDLRLGTFSIANQTDHKTYDLNFEPAALPVSDLNRLKIGSEVMVTAAFTGNGYRAKDIDIIASQAEK